MLPAALLGGIPAGGRGCAWPLRAQRVIPVTRTAPSVAERKCWGGCGLRRRVLGQRSCSPGRRRLPGSLASPPPERVVLQQPAVPALTRVTLGCAGLCFKTSHKSFIKKKVT